MDYDENIFIPGYKKNRTLKDLRKESQKENKKKSEAGLHIELSVFGQILTKLNTSAAKFLSSPENWGKVDFQVVLEKKNFKEMNFKCKSIYEVNIRAFISESGNELRRCCHTGMFRTALRKQKKYSDS